MKRMKFRLKLWRMKRKQKSNAVEHLKKIRSDSTEYENLAETLFDSIDTDGEKLSRVGYYFAKAYIENNIDDLLIAICGWSMKSLIEMSNELEERKECKDAE